MNTSCSFSYTKILINFIIIALLILTEGCDTNTTQKANTQQNDSTMELNNQAISEKTTKSIQVLSNSKILFAHHSVGMNVLNGLDALSKEAGSQIDIINIDDQSPADSNMIASTTGGENSFPKSKIDSFIKTINNLDSGFKPQVAFMKLCYVDITPDTNVNDVFNYYKSQMSKLERENPDIKFLHLTVPLTTLSNGLKNKIKILLGKKTWDEASNIKRAEYNNLIIENYKDSVFDIAKIESTRIDGSRVSFKSDGNTYYSLAPEYTTDGGHLNELGQRDTALQMIEFLANTISVEVQKAH